jgi:hypothetical protein
LFLNANQPDRTHNRTCSSYSCNQGSDYNRINHGSYTFPETAGYSVSEEACRRNTEQKSDTNQADI